MPEQKTWSTRRDSALCSVHPSPSIRPSIIKSKKEKHEMEKSLFEDLVQSLKEAKEIKQGTMQAARRTVVAPWVAKPEENQIGFAAITPPASAP